MPLTPQQRALLAELEEEAKKPEPRTDKGIVGVLHTLIDIVGGRVPHVSPDAIDELHTQTEYDGDPPEPDTGEATAATG
jgi:hypothetical protein